jgi:hypothetical protein
MRLLAILPILLGSANAFATINSAAQQQSTLALVPLQPRAVWHRNTFLAAKSRVSLVSLHASSDDEVEVMDEPQQVILGSLGIFCSLVVFVSEYVLKTTGCGLPAGPGGLFGLIEGISYLGVIGLAGYATYTKIKTGSGLPAGPGGVLGAAEGLSFLAVIVGLVVLALQVSNYGYIPNAVSMEGGMCS